MLTAEPPSLGLCFLGCLSGSRRGLREWVLSDMFDPLNLFVKAQFVQVRSEWLREDTVMFSLLSPVWYHCLVSVCRNTSGREYPRASDWLALLNSFFFGVTERKNLSEIFSSFYGWLIETKRHWQSFRSMGKAFWLWDSGVHTWEGVSDQTSSPWGQA